MKSNAWQRLEGALALDEGGRVSLPLLLAVAAVAAASWLLFHAETPWRFQSGDAFEYGEMARRLAEGRGFTTGVIYPAELWLGAQPDHPAVKFPPAWPLLLSGLFLLSGPLEAAAHALTGVLVCAVAVAAAALGMSRGGRAAGCVAGLAVATSPELMLFSMDAVSEPAFAFWVTLLFLLLARGARGFWLGGVCGLAYLTRYNGALLLPVVMALLWARGAPRGAGAALAGFLLPALPWWTRNLLVAGDPFYSLLNLNLYAAGELRLGSSIFFQIDPAQPPALAAALAKVASQGPRLLAHLPLASANLAALAGVALACVRRDALALAFAATVAGTLVVVAAALPLGRYFVPLFPVLFALGAAGWIRYGGRLRLPALALLLAAPLLPAFPRPLPDVAFLRAQRGTAAGAGETTPRERGDCLSDRSRVIAQDAARVTWRTGAVAVYAPLAPETFWRIVDAHPVDFALISHPPLVTSARFAQHFQARPDCGPHVYEPAAERSSTPARSRLARNRAPTRDPSL
jgi:hypothetical protein